MRITMIGGFLGAGKTTTIARLARHYLEAGQRVGIVTNDQAAELVDTQFLRSQGFSVGEVAGACFCCKFDALAETLGQLDRQIAPDVILTEPVGSCTDLVATVVEPLRALHGDRYEMGPLAVLLKPEHGQRILTGGPRVGFSPQAEYIFLKQLEEADVVAVNKVDRLDREAREQLKEALEARFSGKPVLFVSARTGEGFDELLPVLDCTPARHESMMEVDYERYAAGEAELGWLNAAATACGSAFSLDQLTLQLAGELASRLETARMEAAHVKILAESEGDVSMSNIVSSDCGAELSLACSVHVDRADLTVNARVAGDPDLLKTIVEDGLDAVGAMLGVRLALGAVHHFRPAPPVPTHRFQSGE